MGLLDEKMKLKFKEAADKKEKFWAEKGYPIKFSVLWETLSPLNETKIGRCDTIMGQFSTRLNDYHMNKELPAYKMAWDALLAEVDGLVVAHGNVGSTEYDYKLEKQGKKLVFTADLEKFTFAASSGKQKALKQAIEELL